MTIKNMLILAVLMCFGILDLSQAETILGMDIPRLNVTRMIGKWYFLVSVTEDQRIACTTPIIEQQSADNFTVNVIFTLTPATLEKNPALANQSLAPIKCIMKEEDSNIVICNNHEGLSMAMVVFIVDYDSHMAIHATHIHTEGEITTGTNAFILIVGRRPTLPDGLIEKVEQSSIYQQGVDHDKVKLVTLDTSGCQ